MTLLPAMVGFLPCAVCLGAGTGDVFALPVVFVVYFTVFVPTRLPLPTFSSLLWLRFTRLLRLLIVLTEFRFRLPRSTFFIRLAQAAPYP